MADSKIKINKKVKGIYSLRNGTVNKIELDKFNEFKALEDEKIANAKKPKGFHSITLSDSLAHKKANPQNKLWYYDKSQYVKDEEIPQEEGDVEEDTRRDERRSRNYREEEEDEEEVEEEEEEEEENEEEDEAPEEIEKEETKERAATPPSPRAALKPLPTLAAVMKRKDDDDEVPRSNKSSLKKDSKKSTDEIEPEKIITKQIVTSSGRKLNLRI